MAMAPEVLVPAMPNHIPSSLLTDLTTSIKKIVLRVPSPEELDLPTETNLSNCAVIWRPREFGAMELQFGSEVTVEYPRHWHDEFYLSATLAGTSYLDCGGQSLPVSRGKLVVLPPGVVHANEKMPQCTSRTVFLDFKAMQSVVEHFVEQRISDLDFCPGLLDDRQTTQDFIQMHQALEQPKFELKEESYLSLFLTRLVKGHSSARISSSGEGNEDVAVSQAKRFLEDHYSERVVLGDLGRLTRLSPYHLNRSFCRKVGMPPHAYQLQLRISYAKRFLRSGHSVSETAYLVGFFDQSHFVHAFKRSEGLTPSQFAVFSKNLQAGKAHTHYIESTSPV